MPKVLLLSLVFAPDGVSTAQLMTELATDLQVQGAEVCVITTRPHYNRDRVAEDVQPLRPVWPGLLWRSEIGGVVVYHTRVSAKSGGLLGRAIGWLVFHLIAAVTALVKVRRADIIFVPSPLLTLGALGRLLRHPLRAKMVYNVQELYPDLGVELGMIRNPLVIASLRWLERYVYRGAAAITTITDGIRDAVIQKRIPASRVLTIPNFVDTSDLKPGVKENAFAKTHGWVDRFVVLYAGNIGHAQRLDGLLEAARLLEADPRVLVAFVGEGNDKARLMSAATELGLGNVQFLEHQPYAVVPDIYAASDLCVVSLSEGILVGALPSKVFRIMACQRPVLALCDTRSDLATLVRTAGSGSVCQPDDGRAIAEGVHALATSPERADEMGRRGRKFVLASVARSSVTARYFRLFSELAA